MNRHRRLQGAFLRWLASIAALLPACSAQVEPDYPGEPIATLHGFVASQAALESDQKLSAAIVWERWGTHEGPQYIADRTAVTDRFPAAFSLDLYAAPPRQAEATTIGDYCLDDVHALSGHAAVTRESCERLIPAGTRTGLWVGLLAAVDSDIPDGKIERTDIKGVDTDHVLLYRAHDDPSASPLPSTPTDAQLAERLHLVSVAPGESIDRDYHKGYQLLRFNPAYQEVISHGRECHWKDLCVQWQGATSQDFDWADWNFTRCTERFPDNPTCTAFIDTAAAGEPSASTECRERYKTLTRDCSTSTSEPEFRDNPKNLADPVTIQLGMSFWDADW